MRGVALDQIVQVLDGLESRPIAIARERCSQGLLLAMFSAGGHFLYEWTVPGPGRGANLIRMHDVSVRYGQIPALSGVSPRNRERRRGGRRAGGCGQSATNVARRHSDGHRPSPLQWPGSHASHQGGNALHQDPQVNHVLRQPGSVCCPPERGGRILAEEPGTLPTVRHARRTAPRRGTPLGDVGSHNFVAIREPARRSPTIGR
jgi:hypothetical protein